VKPEYEGLALQNNNNKAPDRELATVPCLHGYIYRTMMVDIAILARNACAVR